MKKGLVGALAMMALTQTAAANDLNLPQDVRSASERVEPRQPAFYDIEGRYKPLPKTMYLVPIDVTEAKVYDRNGNLLGIAKDTVLGPSHLPDAIVVETTDGTAAVQKLGDNVELVLPYDTVDVRTGNQTIVKTDLSTQDAMETARVNERSIIEESDRFDMARDDQQELAGLPQQTDAN